MSQISHKSFKFIQIIALLGLFGGSTAALADDCCCTCDAACQAERRQAALDARADLKELRDEQKQKSASDSSVEDTTSKSSTSSNDSSSTSK